MWCRSQLLSTGLDGYIVLYDLARLTAKKLVPSIGGAIWCIAKNKSETKIVVGTEGGYVVIYEMQVDGILFEKTLNKQDCELNYTYPSPYVYLLLPVLFSLFKHVYCLFVGTKTKRFWSLVELTISEFGMLTRVKLLSVFRSERPTKTKRH